MPPSLEFPEKETHVVSARSGKRFVGDLSEPSFSEERSVSWAIRDIQTNVERHSRRPVRAQSPQPNENRVSASHNAYDLPDRLSQSVTVTEGTRTSPVWRCGAPSLPNHHRRLGSPAGRFIHPTRPRTSRRMRRPASILPGWFDFSAARRAGHSRE